MSNNLRQIGFQISVAVFHSSLVAEEMYFELTLHSITIDVCSGQSSSKFTLTRRATRIFFVNFENVRFCLPIDCTREKYGF